MQVSIAICEDEAVIREEIAGLVQSHDDGYALDCFGSAAELLNAGRQYDIYILDIQMPGVSGMELAEKLRGDAGFPGPVIIFVTAMREYMPAAFDVQAYHFLVKPIDSEKFNKVLAGAVSDFIRRNRREQVTVQLDGRVYTVMLKDIFFVESSRNKVVLHTKAGAVEYYGKIGEFTESLDSDSMFIRCHRCYIVNMEHIARFDEKSIFLKNGQEIFISRTKYTEFAKAYMQYAMT